MNGRSFILEQQSLPTLTTWFSYEGHKINENKLVSWSPCWSKFNNYFSYISYVIWVVVGVQSSAMQFNSQIIVWALQV